MLIHTVSQALLDVLFSVFRVACVTLLCVRIAVKGYSSMREQLSHGDRSEIIALALSDHVSFDQIQRQYGLREHQVKELMRKELQPGSYRAWRRRVRTFSDRRATYK